MRRERWSTMQIDTRKGRNVLVIDLALRPVYLVWMALQFSLPDCRAAQESYSNSPSPLHTLPFLTGSVSSVSDVSNLGVWEGVEEPELHNIPAYSSSMMFAVGFIYSFFMFVLV